MAEDKLRLLSMLTLSILLIGAVLPGNIGFVFADEDDENTGQGDNGEGDQSTGQQEEEDRNQGQGDNDQNTRDEEDEDDGDDDEDEIRASQVPEAVMTAALSSLSSAGVKAVDLREADLEDGVYELEFKTGGQEYEVKVKLEGSTATVLETEVEDDEADEPLATDEDEDSVDIDSEDNSIEFSKDEPKVEFKIPTNATELKFEARFKALVEFSDSDNSTKLEKGEDVFKLDLEDLRWNVTSTLAPDNSTIIVTYSTVSDGYEIEIEMMVPQSEGGDVVKATIKVHKWTWQNGSTENLLALLSEVRAQVEAEGVELPGDVLQVEGLTIAIQVDELAIQYTLENQVIIGTDPPTDVMNAYTTKLQTETEFDSEDGESETEAKVKMDTVVVYPNFGNASMIHDPKIGFIDDPAQVGAIKAAIQRVSGTPLLGSMSIVYAAIAITLVAVALFALRRRISLNHAFPASR